MALLSSKSTLINCSGRKQGSGCYRVASLLSSGRLHANLVANRQRLSSTVPRAYAAALENSTRGSLDPMAASWANAEEYAPGKLLTIKSAQQFDDLVAANPEKLIVLMCKSHSCRPCKMFTRKYLAIAERFPECIMCEIYGDDTPDTRKMMMRMQVKVTPTFRMYRQNECVSILTGTNEKKLIRGVLSHLFPAELANHEREIADTMSLDSMDSMDGEQPAVVPQVPAVTH